MIVLMSDEHHILENILVIQLLIYFRTFPVKEATSQQGISTQTRNSMYPNTVRVLNVLIH